MDEYLGSVRDFLKQINHISIGQADTAMARRGTDMILAVCAVDVDIALQGIRVFLIKTVEPQDAG